MIYATALKPKFARLNPPTAYISVNEDQWKNTFQRALKINQPFSDRESVAFDLFTMAHKVRQSADARFVLLFAAFETLLKPAKRPKETRDHVDGLIEDTKKSILSEEEKKSLVGSLNYLRDKSINSSARELVRTRLGDETLFGGIPAEELYKKSYKLRNSLLHGNLPFPDWQEVSSVAGPFEQMVSKLISGDLITY